MNFENLFQEINVLREKVDFIYIYGFGLHGRNLYQTLKKHGIVVDGFVVTNKSNDIQEYEVPVYEASCVFGGKTGYILGLNEINANEVKRYLKENAVEPQCIIDAGEFMRQFGERHGTYNGSIEVTTVIGCKVGCRYCPQGLLTTKYFEQDRSRARVMTMETFRKCLEFFPKEYDVSFGGMSEPFLNGQFVEMLEIACKAGKHISLFTTLVGAAPEQVDRILELPIQYVVLHVADKYGYAHIPLTENYYRNVEKLINGRKANGTPFVNMCNAQAEPDDRIKQICERKYEIFTELTDRAGNLEGANLIQNHKVKGALRCSQLGEKMNCNILLPDGSVLLCCMDYGLKHILGNIHANTFEEIMSGSEMRKVKEGMSGNEMMDILCRNCSYAREI